MAAAKRISRTRAAPAAGKSELDETLAAIHKQYGNMVAVRGSEVVQPERISSGSFMFDFATLGGIPSNRLTMFLGQKHSGKTTMGDKIIGNCQRQFEGRACKVDVEGTHDSVWSEKNGVDNDALILIQPETGEQAVDMADAMVRTRDVSLVVVDSIAALTPMKEVDSSAEDALVGEQSRLVGRMIRKLTAGLIAERNRGHFVTVLFINQFRTKIGGWAPNGGEPRSIPGGKALEYATSLQVIFKNKENKGKDAYDVETIGLNEHSFDITKNKLNSGPRQGEFQMLRVPNEELGLRESDIDDAATMLYYAKKFGAYHGGGQAWRLEFDQDAATYRRTDDAVAALYEDPAYYWRLRNFLIRTQAEHLGMPQYMLDRFENDYSDVEVAED